MCEERSPVRTSGVKEPSDEAISKRSVNPIYPRGEPGAGGRYPSAGTMLLRHTPARTSSRCSYGNDIILDFKKGVLSVGRVSAGFSDCDGFCGFRNSLYQKAHATPTPKEPG